MPKAPGLKTQKAVAVEMDVRTAMPSEVSTYVQNALLDG